MTTFKEHLQKLREELTTDEEFAKSNPGLQERLEKIENVLEDTEKEEKKDD